MSNVIQVLEQMGNDANVQSEDAINSLLVATELESEITESIINKDVTSLERQLDVRLDMVCGIVPAEDDEDESEGEDSTEEASNRVIGFY